MKNPSPSRREFLRSSSFGFAAMGGGALLLPGGIEPTPSCGEARDYEAFLASIQDPQEPSPLAQDPTDSTTEGPFYIPGAPFRGKISPPMVPGKALLIRGRVWGHDTKKPLPGALLDVWQADARGRYDNTGLLLRPGGGPRNRPGSGRTAEADSEEMQPPRYLYRTRLRADEKGYYEYETIEPAGYGAGRGSRTPHIHYIVRAKGYRKLTTQCFFAGEPLNEKDSIFRESLTIDLETVKGESGAYSLGDFDIVLVREA